MKAALQNYLDSLNAADIEAITGLFADDATVEDPVGTEVHRGKDAIVQFYRHAVGTGARFSLDAPIRASFSNAAAMAVSVRVVHMEKPTCVHVIEVVKFNGAGEFISMQVFFGKSDMELLE
jgi:steroid delta-isomerase